MARVCAPSWVSSGISLQSAMRQSNHTLRGAVARTSARRTSRIVRSRRVVQTEARTTTVHHTTD
eukprot:9500733-Pyramimonas_sp.AAC.2